MTRLFQLAAAFLICLALGVPRRCRRRTTTAADLFAADQERQEAPKENVEWLWQYGPPPADGRENRARPRHPLPPLPRAVPHRAADLLGQSEDRLQTLAETALDFLSVPDKVLADDNRYLTITGCVFRFCPARGLLWVDLNGPHPLVVFAAIDWIKDSKTPTSPAPNTPSGSSPTTPSTPNTFPQR